MVKSRPKSIFHNFQKHLIVVLKKLVPIRKYELERCSEGGIAYKLWRIFIETPSYNKRVLQTILGNDDCWTEIESAKKENTSQIRALKDKHKEEEIRMAQ